MLKLALTHSLAFHLNANARPPLGRPLPNGPDSCSNYIFMKALSSSIQASKQYFCRIGFAFNWRISKSLAFLQRFSEQSVLELTRVLECVTSNSVLLCSFVSLCFPIVVNFHFKNVEKFVNSSKIRLTKNASSFRLPEMNIFVPRAV